MCVITRTTRKLKVVKGRFTYRTIALLSEISILLVRAVCEIPSVSLWIQTRIETTLRNSNTTVCIYGRYTYRMTALLSQMSIFCVGAGFEIQMVSYASKHVSKSLSDKPFLHIPWS